MASGKRYEGVQALRFIAALLVVATHSTLYASDRLDPSIEVWHLGEVGVDIFFTISGFVMVVSTGSLVGTRDGWKYFGMRRLVRIAPMYWIATSLKVITVIAIPSAAIHSSLQPANTVLSYVFLPSWNSEGRLEPVLGVGWTLTYEMFFYAVFTLALLVRVSPMWFCSGVLGACALATLLRPSDANYPAAMFYLSPIVLYFVVGMAIGRWSQNRDWKGLLATLGAVVVLWVVIAFGRPELSDVDSVSAVLRNVAVSALLLAVVGFERHLRRVPRSIVFLGDASYSLYLFHPLVAPLVPIALGIVGVRVGWVSVVGSIAAAIVAAALIYRLVEMPMTAVLRERLPYMKQRSPAPIES